MRVLGMVEQQAWRALQALLKTGPQGHRGQGPYVVPVLLAAGMLAALLPPLEAVTRLGQAVWVKHRPVRPMNVSEGPLGSLDRPVWACRVCFRGRHEGQRPMVLLRRLQQLVVASSHQAPAS